MNRRTLLATAAAVVGLVAIVVGIHQELLHIGAGYDGTVDTGWGGDINHEERLLAWLGGLGVVGAAATARMRHAALVPMATGGVVLFYGLRAVLHHALDPGLYTEFAVRGGRRLTYVLGAEPFLLVAGGLLLVAAGVIGRRPDAARRPHDAASDDAPSA